MYSRLWAWLCEVPDDGHIPNPLCLASRSWMKLWVLSTRLLYHNSALPKHRRKVFYSSVQSLYQKQTEYDRFSNSLESSVCTCAHQWCFQLYHTKQCCLEWLWERVHEQIPASWGRQPTWVLLGYRGRVHIVAVAGPQGSTGSNESALIQDLQNRVNKC